MVPSARNYVDVQTVHQGAYSFFFIFFLPSSYLKSPPPPISISRSDTPVLIWISVLQAIDVWSVGCILAEMLSGKPIFPGRDYHHQLTLILDVLGTPTLDEFYAISSRRSRDYIRFVHACHLIYPPRAGPLTLYACCMWYLLEPFRSGRRNPFRCFIPMPLPWPSTS